MNAQIQHVIKQITNHFRPEKSILFGSYAYGMPGRDSDVDLLVIMKHTGPAKKQAVKILQAIDYHFPLDLIVRSPQQISRRIKAGDFFLNEIMEKGKVLYEKNCS